jgi:hypothetical protein
MLGSNLGLDGRFHSRREPPVARRGGAGCEAEQRLVLQEAIGDLQRERQALLEQLARLAQVVFRQCYPAERAEGIRCVPPICLRRPRR